MKKHDAYAKGEEDGRRVQGHPRVSSYAVEKRYLLRVADESHECDHGHQEGEDLRQVTGPDLLRPY